MAETTIEWADYTFNPWIGCAKVAAGCKHCYAERDFDLRRGFAQWGPNGTRVKTSDANWRKPLAWNNKAEAVADFERRHGDLPVQRPRVFCASLADVFEEWVGPISNSSGQHLVHTTEGYHAEDHEAMEGCSRVTMDDLRRDLFRLIDATPHLDWLLLTKRPQNIRRMWTTPTAPCCPRDHNGDGDCDRHPNGHRPNVWLLTSVAEQKDADRNIPHLLGCRDLAPVLGVSAEPLIGPVDLTQLGGPDAVKLEGANRPLLRVNALRGVTDPPSTLRGADSLGKLDWVIAGGESGHGARPMHPDWARSLRDQCAAAGVPFLFKQWGEWAPEERHVVMAPKAEGGNFAHLPDGSRVYANDPRPSHVWLDSELGPHADADRCWSMRRVGKKAAGRLLDGVTHDGFPHPIPAALEE